MKISDIEHLARLARIEVSASEQESLLSDIENILAFVGQIQNVDVSLEASARLGTPYNVFREDGQPHESGVYTDALMEEVPEMQEGYIKVKKILNNE